MLTDLSTSYFKNTKGIRLYLGPYLLTKAICPAASGEKLEMDNTPISVTNNLATKLTTSLLLLSEDGMEGRLSGKPLTDAFKIVLLLNIVKITYCAKL